MYDRKLRVPKRLDRSSKINIYNFSLANIWIVKKAVQDMENAIKEYVSVIKDGMESLARKNHVQEIALEMENVSMECVPVTKTLKANFVMNSK